MEILNPVTISFFKALIQKKVKLNTLTDKQILLLKEVALNLKKNNINLTKSETKAILKHKKKLIFLIKASNKKIRKKIITWRRSSFFKDILQPIIL